MKKDYRLSIALILLFSISCNLPFGVSPLATNETASISNESEEEGQTGEALPLQAGNPLIPNCDMAFTGHIHDTDVHQTPDLPKPAPHQPFADPIFGTCLVRVTDRSHDLLGEDASGGLKNEYSRVQSFNADESLLVVRSIESYWYLYDANSLHRLGQLPVNTEPRWDSENPHLIYYVDESRLMAYNLESASADIIHDFAVDFPGESLSAVWTRYEGSPSLDTRYWGMMVQDENWSTIALVVYDRKEDQIAGVRMLPEKPSIDSVTISPLGSYLLVYHDDYCEYEELGSLEKPCGLMVYDHTLQTGRGMLRIIGHSDTALDSDGREVLVYQDIDTDHISMLDLESGAITPLKPIDFSHSATGLHFSGRALYKPGWALVSTYNGSHPENRTWMDDMIFAIELKPDPRILRLAHTHSWYSEDMEQDYWAEPHASASPDFSRVLFTSNWGRSGTEEVEMYMLFLDSLWEEIDSE